MFHVNSGIAESWLRADAEYHVWPGQTMSEFIDAPLQSLAFDIGSNPDVRREPTSATTKNASMCAITIRTNSSKDIYFASASRSSRQLKSSHPHKSSVQALRQPTHGRKRVSKEVSIMQHKFPLKSLSPGPDVVSQPRLLNPLHCPRR